MKAISLFIAISFAIIVKLDAQTLEHFKVKPDTSSNGKISWAITPNNYLMLSGVGVWTLLANQNWICQN